MDRHLLIIALGAFAVLSAPAMAQITSPVTPGPGASLPTVLALAVPAMQNVTILNDKVFPPTVFARVIDVIRFTNNDSSGKTITATDGSWSTGEIAPGAFIDVPYVAIHALDLASGGASAAYDIEGGATPQSQPSVSFVSMNGALSGTTNWNAYDLVPPL